MDLTKLSKDELQKELDKRASKTEEVMENKSSRFSKEELSAIEKLSAMGFELGNIQKNEVPMSTEPAVGGELIKELSTEIIKVSQELTNNMLTPAVFPGFQGNNLPESKKFAVVGEVGFMRAGGENKTGPIGNRAATSKAATKKVVITQGQYDIRIDVTRRLKTFGMDGLEEFVKQEIAKSWTKTLNAVVFNADDADDDTNINFSGAAVSGAAEDYFLVSEAPGFRKLAIDEANTVLVGDVDYEGLVEMIAKMGSLANNPSDCVFALDRQTYVRYLTVPEFKDASENGKNSVIHTGAHFNFLGSDVFIVDSLGKTDVNGVVSSTPANNTKGQILYIHKSALQWGYGDNINLKMYDYGADGIQLEGWGYFGHNIFNEYQSGECPVVLGRGVNLA